ncbi:MAG: hypothetical protein ACLTSX_03890 [Collinsella sp.]
MAMRTSTRIPLCRRWGCVRLSRVSVVRDGVAERIVDEYGSLQDLMDDIKKDPDRLGKLSA